MVAYVMKSIPLPPHGTSLLKLEIISELTHREVFNSIDADGKPTLVPCGSGTCNLIVRFPGGQPFPVTVDSADFQKIVMPALVVKSHKTEMEGIYRIKL